MDLTSTAQWYDQKKAYLDSLEIQLRGLVKSIDIVAKHRAGAISGVLIAHQCS
jgi:hypothetical protein